MAHPEALNAAKLGTSAFRSWRLASEVERVDLSGADLRGVDLRWSNFAGANLEGAKLDGALLTGAYFGPAWFTRSAPFSGRADVPACLNGASLSDSVLLAATFNYPELNDTNFDGCYLGLANFRHAVFTRTSLNRAQFLNTSLMHCDLTDSKFLSEIEHLGPSHIDIETIELSKSISTRFLQQTGMSKERADFLLRLHPEKMPITNHSFFLSHSTADKSFCDRLYSRLVDEGIRVWYAPEDIRAGELIAKQLLHAVRKHDKLLIVLSEKSLRSNWVANELRWALQRENESKSQMLFPISLVSFDRLQQWELIDPDTGIDIAARVRSYYLPDFSDWQEKNSFDQAFLRLIRDLRISIQEGQLAGG
ncbi:toll/interleukin-1 receptor domain-containing protein [Lysobacter hankyongensis]|uniref:toll/interleukin-1 receptor domain-containing protein n=1 Tax=Lysobacter hankyongensis TaxID=1176535 RepID=UPI0031F09075